jgi:hypothetical protein
VSRGKARGQVDLPAVLTKTVFEELLSAFTTDEQITRHVEQVVQRGLSGHAAPYRPRSIATRGRRSAAQLEDLLQIVRALLAQQSGPISIRHLFYLTVAAGAIEKTERGYQNLKHQLTRWRRSGAIEWTAFSDSTRWYYGRPGYSGMRALLEEQIRLYRYDLWAREPVHVEIWAEKDAIASILLEAADPWRVQVFPFRGFASLTSLYNAAETFREKQAEGKDVYVYYFGDHDPSGVAIDPAAGAALRGDFGVKIQFERVAITTAQIATYQLPTRPTKDTDSRAKAFAGDSVEIDAMPRDALTALVEQCITQHLPAGALERTLAAEREERASTEQFLTSWTRAQKRKGAR